MSKSTLLKNARNYAEYLRKKERGPVKAFFHITKNENVPAIEQQGLLTNHPNANVNSANHPFRKHGTDAGGVWVTTEPTAFPVYGTTIGGKNGNAEARADALSTIKIEVPLPELRNMKAVQDPYGRNILRKGDDPRAIDKFPTWAGIDVPSTVFLDDIKPQWLKNIGYVEETPDLNPTPTLPTLAEAPSGWRLPPRDNTRRWLDKGRMKDYVGETGHRHGKGSYDKSPQRLVNEEIANNQPITKRLPVFPVPNDEASTMLVQGAKLKYDSDGNVIISAPNELKRYSTDFIPAETWTTDYENYVKPGESIKDKRYFKFAPGAIARGMGGMNMPSIKERNFNWNAYKQSIAEGNAPSVAAANASPEHVLDWDNIVYKGIGYTPNVVKPADGRYLKPNVGHISAGTPRGHVQDVITGRSLVNPNVQGATQQFYQLGPGDIESLKHYSAYDDIVKDKDNPTWQELVRVIMRINAGTSTPYWR